MRLGRQSRAGKIDFALTGLLNTKVEGSKKMSLLREEKRKEGHGKIAGIVFERARTKFTSHKAVNTPANNVIWEKMSSAVVLLFRVF